MALVKKCGLTIKTAFHSEKRVRRCFTLCYSGHSEIREVIKKNSYKAVRLTAWVDPEAVRKM